MSLGGRWEDTLKGTRSAGVEINLQGTGMAFTCVVIEKKKSKLDIASSAVGAALSELKVPNGVPMSISVSGKGIIHKKVSYSPDMNAASLLQKTLPNAKIEEFYVQHTEPVNSHVIVSVARKSSIDELLAEMEKAKLDVVECTLGPFCLSALAPMMELNSVLAEDIRVPGHTITVVDGQLGNYTAEENHTEQAVSIGGDRIKPEQLVAFAAAAGYFIGHDLTVTTDGASAQREEFRQKRIFKLAGASFLVFLFCLLLANYLVFDHYWKKKQSFEVQYLGNQDALQKYAKLKADYDEKMIFLESSGLLETSRSSYYADRIAVDLPATINLTELNINPREKPQADEDAMQFRAKEISIQGNSRQSTELNEWIKALKRKDWVKEVELINYKQGKGESVGTFIIAVKVK